jgi:hypothetical protein
MDKYYGNVCELDIIFSFTKAYYILDELLLAGELQESSKKNVLRCISQQDSLEDMEVRCPHFLLLFSLFSSGQSPTKLDSSPSLLFVQQHRMYWRLTIFRGLFRLRMKSRRSCNIAALSPFMISRAMTSSRRQPFI